VTEFPIRRRILIALASLAVASVTLTGCLFSFNGGTAKASRSATPDTAGIAAPLRPFYGQTVRWTPCNSTFECAKVKAPLDWSDPAKASIELAIIRHKASDGTPIGSLLVNPGGPGASGVELIRDSLDYAVGTKLANAYDVVGFDPRGVGESTAVKCFGPTQMDAYLFDIPKSPRNTPAWKAEILAAAKTFGDACKANSGGILPYITTVNAARDLDLLRGVLGDAKLNYLGYSYGTFLGATYAKLYPKRVGRFVLDGALDPSVSGLDVSVSQGLGFEAALRSYLQYCLGAKGCPFSGTVDDAMADVGTLLASVDRAPERNSDGRMLGADSLVTAIVAALYSQDSWPYLTQAFTGVLKGNPSAAFQLVDFYYNRNDGEYSDNSTEAFNAYNCMDYPDDATPAQLADAMATLAAQAPVIAPYWSTDVNTCDVWPYKATGVREKINADGAGPIVVLGTTGDPATPYAWAVSLAKQLSSGVLLTRVGQGHTGFNKGNSCIDNAVNSYFLAGTVPTNGLRCT
jgi:pimeloyl-ACP methyl ester carboxylesterase